MMAECPYCHKNFICGDTEECIERLTKHNEKCKKKFAIHDNNEEVKKNGM